MKGMKQYTGDIRPFIIEKQGTRDGSIITDYKNRIKMC